MLLGCSPGLSIDADDSGRVVGGPAPLSLALVHADVDDDKVLFVPWVEGGEARGGDGAGGDGGSEGEGPATKTGMERNGRWRRGMEGNDVD
uniref:Uncharacterized protein n=1 Tax=Oryza nivara TaxID=4536 RepID=A0A0E0GZU9_ORYNI